MKKIVAAVAAAGVAVGGVLLAPAAGAENQGVAAYNPPPIEWGQCENPDLVEAGAECGMLIVPLDYAKPEGEKIKLAISRIKHKSPDSEYQGPMLVNPGGPGGSGLDLAVLGQYVPKKAGEQFDWIGFDPRGVGSSEPALSCDPKYHRYDRPDYVPTTRQLEQTWLKRSKGYARKCGAAGGKLLSHIKTRDSVKDMESIRKALDAEKINYYGFSYGTYLGQVYASHYPHRLGKVVFDGIVNPKKVWYQANLDQDVYFDRVIKIYFEWISRYDDVYHLGDEPIEVEQKFYEVRKQLDKKPAGGKIGSSEWTDLFLPAGYGQYRWDTIAKAFSGWVHKKDYKPLIPLYDRASGLGDDNGYAVYAAVQCTDVQWPRDWDRWREDNRRIHNWAPFETWANAWYNAPCVYWPAKAGWPAKVDGSKAPPTLLISEEEDAATPYPGALEVRERFPKASLISLPGGTTHSGSLGGNACVDDQIADYLLTGKLPERKNGNDSDAQCTPLPKPVPEGAKQRQVRTLDQPNVLDRALDIVR